MAARESLLAVVAEPMSPELARTLDLAGYSWKNVTSSDDSSQPAGGWSGSIVDVSTDADGGWAFLRNVRKGGDRAFPVMLLVGGGQLGELEHRDELFDDFCLTPFHPAELEARLRHLMASDVDVHRAELVEYGELTLNLEAYQAAISG
ncbi:MAG: hypothetical protein ACR2OH_06895, partial [Microthrixaceae bacterium]